MARTDRALGTVQCSFAEYFVDSRGAGDVPREGLPDARRDVKYSIKVVVQIAGVNRFVVSDAIAKASNFVEM